MSQHAFYNCLRLLSGIDHHEVPALTDGQWLQFRDDPHGFFIRCDDAARDEIWRAMEQRLPQLKAVAGAGA